MVSYRAKGINKVTSFNLALPGSNRLRGIFLLAALVSTGSPPATARLLCSSRSRVTCPYSTRRRRRRDFDLHPGRTPTRRAAKGKTLTPKLATGTLRLLVGTYLGRNALDWMLYPRSLRTPLPFTQVNVSVAGP